MKKANHETQSQGPEPPITTSDAPIKWVNQSPSVVNLSATDNYTGVTHTYYSINVRTFTEGNSITVDKEVLNKISFYSVDKVGNKEEVQTIYVKIDKTAPIITMVYLLFVLPYLQSTVH